MAKKDVTQIIANPTSFFHNPAELADSDTLSSEAKILALKQWDSEIRQLEVANEENMVAATSISLTEVHAALRSLGVEPAGEHSGSDKSGHLD